MADDSSSVSSYDEEYLQKLDDFDNVKLLEFHPEVKQPNMEEVLALSKVVRDKNGKIIDELHKSIPFLTKYEKTKILGLRAKQINEGSFTFIKVPDNVIDGYTIAQLELKEQKIPFIIRRPMPNGSSEYWNIQDLEYVDF